MKYKKIRNLLDNTTNQPPKFKTKHWVEINDKSRGMYNKDIQIRFKNITLKSSFCDYSDVYILAKEIMTVGNTAAQGQRNNAPNKKIIFKNCVPFTKYISRVTLNEI